jgi:hypothetical protein
MIESNTKQPGSSIAYYLFAVTAAIAALGFVLIVGLLFSQSLINMGGENATMLDGVLAMVKDMSRWFDDIFFQYNLLLLSIAVAIPPVITFFYVVGMRQEKIRRLKQGMPEHLYNDDRYNVEQRVNDIFRFRHYLGSMSMLTIIVLLGCMIILLLKPLPLDGSGFGVDYSKGANFLMLGPHMELFVMSDEQYLTKLMGTLTAFQFGFLGAYVYFTTHLMRSYFTLDLTPNSFVASTVRMIMGALVALICSFLFLNKAQALIPIFSFFIGFFPQRGLLLIEKTSKKAFNAVLGSEAFGNDRYFATELVQLPGMSYAHELRLRREGYDNVDNLTTADPVELAVRTGFGFQQLFKWVSQARLMQHLRDDYKDFVHATGLTSIEEINSFIHNWRQQYPDQDPYEELVAAMNLKNEHKIRIICALECAHCNTSQAESQTSWISLSVPY